MLSRFLIVSKQFIKYLFSVKVKRNRQQTLENQQNTEARERYYATIHKVALQGGSDKIPGIFII